THEHLKERALFSFPPPPPGANPSEYYHLMTSASLRSPYGDLLVHNGAAAAAAAAAVHLPDYVTPVDGEENHTKAFCMFISSHSASPRDIFLKGFSTSELQSL
ncbi:hypothetical protein GOODEAATRI_014210, partial [Goodea atripinnis]